MARLLGIDIGTSSCKAVLIDEHGKVLKQASSEHSFDTPQPGWTEQHPEVWMNSTASCLSDIGTEFDALGLTGQMHGSVFLNAQADVVRPAILWNDQRTAKEVDEIRSRVGIGQIYQATCNPPMTGFQAPKILWLRNHEPNLFDETKRILLPKDYIRLRLTGEMATDVSDASGTGLFDVRNRAWSHQMLEACELSNDLFPKSFESHEPVGEYQGKPVVAGAGDQAASAVGTGAVTEEVVSVSLGTSGVVFASQSSSDYDASGRIHTFCHANQGWHSMGVMLSCGGALRWARDSFGFANYDEMAELAQRCETTGVRFKPYLAGERTPHANPNLRGSLENLSLADDRSQIALAVFTGITFGLLDGFEILNEVRGERADTVRVTGGGARSDFWMQLLADAFNCRTVRTSVDEGPAFGAAILAGVGTDVWGSAREACEHCVKEADSFEPQPRRVCAIAEMRKLWLKS